MYVPIALVAVVLGRSSTVITGAATVYVIVRTTFTLGYWLKINTLRSMSWALGMVTVAVLAVAVMT